MNKLPVCPCCKAANRMKVGWLKTAEEGIIEIEVVECPDCGWIGLKSDVTAGRSKNQRTIGRALEK